MPAMTRHVLIEGADILTFSAAEMRQEWVPHWCPTTTPPRPAEEWRRYAAEAHQVVGVRRSWRPPSAGEFVEAILATKGAAGFDGWEADEAVAMTRHAPWLVEELLAIFARITREAPHGLPRELVEELFTWRYVGIPKRGSDDSRPIAIASGRLSVRAGVAADRACVAAAGARRAVGRNRRLAGHGGLASLVWKRRRRG